MTHLTTYARARVTAFALWLLRWADPETYKRTRVAPCSRQLCRVKRATRVE